ncbi:MAG TPA: SurA N-terminal domain-containing protein [Desulfomonilia bacterium]|nr:SurA N-terminal domain-containing protein [Desulfomonilia bacterium]
MLTYFRKHSKGWLAYTAFGAIIVVFILWGGSSYLTREAHMIAKVDRHIISVEQFSKAYTDQLKMYQQRFGDALTPEMLKKLNLKHTVLDQLIDDYIIEAEANHIGITVSEADLQEAISQFPAFNKDGKFDDNIYRRYLEYERITPADFEHKISKEILKQRFVKVLTENVIVPRQELEATFHYMNDSYDLSYLTIDSSSFVKDVQVSQDQIQSYYDANKDHYKIPPKITLAAIEYPTVNYQANIQVTKNDALDYYQGHKADFSEPAKYRARHILFKIPQNADADVLAHKEQLIRKVLAEAKSGKDFAALAAQYSEDDQTAKKGGDMGTLPREGYPQGIGDVIASMKPGDVKGPVKSPMGFHIVKLESKEEAKAIPFDKVESTVVDTLKLQRAKQTAHDEAEKAFMQLYEQSKPDLEAYAKAKGLSVKQIGPFAEGQDTGVSMSAEAEKKTFTFQAGELGEVVTTPGGYLIYRIAKKEPSRIPDLKEVADRVEADLKAKMAVDRAREYAKKLTASKPDQLAAQNPLDTGEFVRTAYSVPNLSMIPKLMDDLDSLTTPKVFENKGTVYVVWIKSKKTADLSTMDKKQTDAIMKQLLNKKHEIALQSYLEQAKKRFKIVKDEEKLNEGGTAGRGNAPSPADY